MSRALFDHQNIMGTEVSRTTTINLDAVQVPKMDLEYLDDLFTDDEIWATIKSLSADKAPGPDGFTTEFYVSAWQIIKEDIIRAMHAFYRTDRRSFHGLNNSLITLLPKKDDAKSATEYRAICLLHSFAKIATKTMARRLAPAMDGLADVNQSAFIKKRSIHDNFRLVQGTAKMFKQRKTSKLLLKLDITKAFDTVSWPFLLQILSHIGFGSKWRS